MEVPADVKHTHLLCDTDWLLLTVAEGAPVNQKATVISFPSLGSSASVLAKRDLSDVCSLSRRAKPEPVSVSLQNGIRFFRPPTPVYPSGSLTTVLPFREIFGVIMFRVST